MVFARNPADVASGFDAANAAVTSAGQKTATSQEKKVYQATGKTVQQQRSSGSSEGGNAVPKTIKQALDLIGAKPVGKPEPVLSSLPFPANIPVSKSKVISLTPPKQVQQTASLDFGKITNVSHSFYQGNDEIRVRVTVKNTSSKTQEYRAYLYTSSGELVDKEPDTYWANVGAGQTRTFTVDSTGLGFDVKDFGGAYRVAILAENEILVDEKIVYLQTGQVTSPNERPEGSFIAGVTAPAISTDVTSTQKTLPSLSKSTEKDGFLSSLGLELNVTTVVLGGLLLYLLGRKK
tara:strand:+ start:2232 stop:3107 length:876 start_codon:yes stop_codon:yes gene_type:complete